MKKILLHVCCGPCATAIVKFLQTENRNVDCLFYNPNIQPWSEYLHRKESLAKYLQKENIKLLETSDSEKNYDKPFVQAVKKNTQKPERCINCYKLRISFTAQMAAENKYDAFTTTLLSSPHQDIECIRKIGEKQATRRKLFFYTPEYGPKKYKGFRPFFTTGRKISKQNKLYEQEYCGCLFSKKERFAKDRD